MMLIAQDDEACHALFHKFQLSPGESERGGRYESLMSPFIATLSPVCARGCDIYHELNWCRVTVPVS